MRFLWFLVIGVLAGWLAGKIMRGGDFGLLGDIIVGVIGALVGHSVFALLGIVAFGFVGSLVAATFGAVLFLYLLRKIKLS